jgi:hypothetical protein
MFFLPCFGVVPLIPATAPYSHLSSIRHIAVSAVLQHPVTFIRVFT